MSTLMVAKSFSTWDRIGEPFDKNGKLYQKVKEKCPRCGGLGIIVARVENGQPIPISVDQGICYQCVGNKYIVKEVRLYTQEEFDRMEAANERACQKKAEEQVRKMRVEFAQKKAEWLEKNNFTPDGITYVVTGDSFFIKDELKANGWRYDPVIKWHKADPAGYEDRVIKISVDDFFEASAWGDYHYLEGAKDKMDKILAATQPQVDSNWIGEVGDKITNLKVQLVRKYNTSSKYGLTTLYSFQDENGNIINWWTSTFQEIEQGDWVTIIRSTIKKLDIYRDQKQTIITRAKLGQISD